MLFLARPVARLSRKESKTSPTTLLTSSGSTSAGLGFLSPLLFGFRPFPSLSFLFALSLPGTTSSSSSANAESRIFSCRIALSQPCSTTLWRRLVGSFIMLSRSFRSTSSSPALCTSSHMVRASVFRAHVVAQSASCVRHSPSTLIEAPSSIGLAEAVRPVFLSRTGAHANACAGHFAFAASCFKFSTSESFSSPRSSQNIIVSTFPGTRAVGSLCFSLWFFTSFFSLSISFCRSFLASSVSVENHCGLRSGFGI
mmetsp:Transcript_19228/g.48105  ORF Transcript_19228/g.48105 Transcript_19228/m.48105 type:complete len:255 (-) Transcript_19228:2362-3126(-)